MTKSQGAPFGVGCRVHQNPTSSWLPLKLGTLCRHDLPFAVSLDPGIGEAILAADILPFKGSFQGADDVI